MTGLQDPPRCSRCGASRDGQDSGTELCVACSQAGTVQASSTQIKPPQNPVSAPQFSNDPGPWWDTRHGSDDRVWNAEYRKISDQEEAQAELQEKWLQKSTRLEQRLSESPGGSPQTSSEGRDIPHRSQAEGSPLPPVPPATPVIPATLAIPATPDIPAISAPPTPPAGCSSQDGQHLPSLALVPALVPEPAPAPAPSNYEQEEAIPEIPSTSSDIPCHPEDKPHPQAPVVPTVSPTPVRKTKLTPACADCKRRKIRCLHRQNMDKDGNIVSDAAPATSKKRKRDVESDSPAESESQDNSSDAPLARRLRLRPPKAPTTEAGPAQTKVAPAPKHQGARGRTRKRKADESECDGESVQSPPAKRGGKGKATAKAKVKKEDTPPSDTLLSGQGFPDIMDDAVAGASHLRVHVTKARELTERLEACRQNLAATVEALSDAEQILEEWLDTWKEAVIDSED